MKKIYLLIFGFLFFSCNNTTEKVIKGPESQETFIGFIYKNYPLTYKNAIQKDEKNREFNEKLRKYVYDSLKHIDGYLMKIKEINLQQLESGRKIEVVLVDYREHLLNIEYHDANLISEKESDSVSVLYRYFINQTVNDFVFVYGTLDTISTFYRHFKMEDYKIDIDSVQSVENTSLIYDKNDKFFY